MSEATMREFVEGKTVAAALISGCTLAIPAWVGLLAAAGPTFLSPYPALTAIPAFLLSSRVAGVAIPPLLFFIWNPRLLQGDNNLPSRSLGLLAIAAALSVGWFVWSWGYGLHYQGAKYTHVLCGINAAWIAFLGGIFIYWGKRKLTFRLNLALHWALFAWLAWYAFPYLGELP